MATVKLSSFGDDHVVKVLLDDDFNDVKTEKALENEMSTTTTMMMTKNGGGVGDDHGGKEKEKEALHRKENGESGCEKEDERQSWSKKREYFLTIMGYIVGIGNIWRFPYMCNRNGGGAFLLPFILCVMFMGLPLFFLETALGQFAGKSPLHVWSVCPLVKGTGIAMCIASLISFWYYNIIMAWALYFIASSFKSTVPWSLCGQWWNTPQCVGVKYRLNGTSVNVTSVWNVTFGDGNDTTASVAGFAAENGNSTEPKPVTAAEEFWQHNVLQASSGLHEPGHLVWYLVVCQCLVIIFMFLAMVKGIKSSGKVVYVTATAPYLMLIVLLVRGVTLPGAVDGILFYITPDFERLLDPNVWIEAALQVFYSLGPGWGGLLAMASYNKFNNNCLK